jgi:hypothetical protein
VCEDCNLVQVIFTTLDGFTELFLTDDHSTALMSARRNTALNTERFVEASYYRRTTSRPTQEKGESHSPMCRWYMVASTCGATLPHWTS